MGSRLPGVTQNAPARLGRAPLQKGETLDALFVAEHFRQISKLKGQAIALWWGEEGYDWDGLRRLGEGLEGALEEARVAPGSSVAWVARNHPAIVGAALGILFSRMCISPVNPHVPTAQLADTLRKLRPGAVVAVAADWSPEILAVAEEIGAAAIQVAMDPAEPVRTLQPGRPHDPAELRPDVIIERISSGTTGEPKRFPVAARPFVKALGFAAASESPANVGATTIKRSPAIIFATFAHSAGLWHLLSAYYHGRPVVLHERFSVEGFRDSMRRFRPKTAKLMPAMVAMLLEAEVPREELASLIAIRTGSAPLDPSLQQAFEETYGVPILIDYGASEFMGGIAAWTLDDWKRFGAGKRGSVGRLRPDMQAQVIDGDTGEPLPLGEVGVLCLKTPRNGPDWVRTTDLASLDEDGFVYLHGRADEAINRGGFKVLPEKVAEALRQHPAVREAAVLGVRDPRLGQAPIAAIETVEGRQRPSAEELDAFLRQRMPPYFIPIAFEFFEELPRTNSMKVSRPAVRQQLQDRYEF